MAFIVKNEEFVCTYCGEYNPPAGRTCRNHCRKCLCSHHVDHDFPGDRKSDCRGKMSPIAVLAHPKHDWVVIHRCEKCGKEISNKIADDDSRETMIQIQSKKI